MTAILIDARPFLFHRAFPASWARAVLFERLHENASATATRTWNVVELQQGHAIPFFCGVRSRHAHYNDHAGWDSVPFFIGGQELEPFAAFRTPTGLSTAKEVVLPAGFANEQLAAGMVRPAGRKLEPALRTSKLVAKHGSPSSR